MFLTTIGMPILSIYTIYSCIHWLATQELFNYQATQGYVLVMSLKYKATLMNLQKNYSTIVFLEVLELANVTTQAIGHVHQIRQTKAQQIFIITKNHLYNQRLQANATKKMYRQIASQSNLQLSNKEYTQAIEEGNSNSNNSKEVLEHAKHNKVVALYTTTFGQQTPRHSQGNVQQLDKKDLLPSKHNKERMIQYKSSIKVNYSQL